LFLDYPDLSLRNFLCFETLDGRAGAYQSLLRTLREWRVETLLLPNAGDFHPDHKAANDAGLVAAEMARATLMPDLGPTAPLRAVFTYQVWEPLDRPTARLVLDRRQGERKGEALSAFASQGTILQELLRRKTLSYTEERFTRLAAF
jgi:LmbE family N-acetylglucosaminyl deacetylase